MLDSASLILKIPIEFIELSTDIVQLSAGS